VRGGGDAIGWWCAPCSAVCWRGRGGGLGRPSLIGIMIMMCRAFVVWQLAAATRRGPCRAAAALTWQEHPHWLQALDAHVAGVLWAAHQNQLAGGDDADALRRRRQAPPARCAGLGHDARGQQHAAVGTAAGRQRRRAQWLDSSPPAAPTCLPAMRKPSMPPQLSATSLFSLAAPTFHHTDSPSSTPRSDSTSGTRQPMAASMAHLRSRAAAAAGPGPASAVTPRQPQRPASWMAPAVPAAPRTWRAAAPPRSGEQSPGAGAPGPAGRSRSRPPPRRSGAARRPSAAGPGRTCARAGRAARHPLYVCRGRQRRGQGARPRLTRGCAAAPVRGPPAPGPPRPAAAAAWPPAAPAPARPGCSWTARSAR
jgi:hypothetical protein